jgi:hypothetical protein
MFNQFDKEYGPYLEQMYSYCVFGDNPQLWSVIKFLYDHKRSKYKPKIFTKRAVSELLELQLITAKVTSIKDADDPIYELTIKCKRYLSGLRYTAME